MQNFPVRLVLDPRTEALVSVYRDEIFIRTYHVTYDAARAGTIVAEPIESNPPPVVDPPELDPPPNEEASPADGTPDDETPAETENGTEDGDADEQ
ncbi:hypothetical protein ABC336_28460 [Paenibacillus sp. 1P07SE]